MMDEKVRVIFLLPQEEATCSEEMTRAYRACKTNSMSVEWIEDSKSLTQSQLEKTDFVVLQSFEGEQFERLKETKCTRIVGPMCLQVCLIEGRAIPNLDWPIFNVAMSDCIITSSHLTRKVKEEIKNRVRAMGGHYTDDFLEGNTHLITDSVKSEKYLKAAEMGVKLMLPSWVNAVWQGSLNVNVHCDDQEFQKFCCSPFHKLTICSTGFTTITERQELEKLVREGGGTFTGQLHINSTDILICKGSTTSAKFKAARKSNRIKCVTYQWVLDSLAKGYALPDTAYSVKKSTSTPTKIIEGQDPNFSVISGISSIGSTTQKSIFQETINLTVTPTTTTAHISRKRKSSSMDDINSLVDCIDINAVKRAGSFLDGCCVFIAGFTVDQRDKVSRILNLGGAIRYEHVSERITHIIVGDSSYSDVKGLQYETHPAPVVSLLWLCECIEQKRVVNEDQFIVNLQSSSLPKNSASPISNKDLKILRREISIMEPADDRANDQNCTNDDTTLRKLEDINDGDEDILQQYKKGGGTTSEEDTLAQLLKAENLISYKDDTSKPRDESQHSVAAVVNAGSHSETTNISLTCTEDDEIEEQQFFQGLKFLIVGFSENVRSHLRECIERAGGELASRAYKGVLDYIVVPIFFHESLKHAAAEIVTDYFIKSCFNMCELAKIEYYHRPLSKKDAKPLEGYVVTVSSYSGTERIFLMHVIEGLGGISQEQLSRVATSELLATTHLLSPEASGKKYLAALKWGVPVIDKNWLMDCARTGKFESEIKYLIGDSKVPERTLKTPKNKKTESAPLSGQNSSSHLKVTETIQTQKSKTLETEASAKHDLTSRFSVPEVDLLRDSLFVAGFTDSLKSDECTGLEENLSDSLKENQSANVQGCVETTRDPQVSNREEAQSTGSRTLRLPSNSTPATSRHFPESDKMCTPLNRLNSDGSHESPQFSSQVTPVQEILKRFRMTNVNVTPKPTPDAWKSYDHVDTPDTPYGACFKANPSPRLRKEMLRWINTLPEKRPRRDSTPLSELRRRLWNKICPSTAANTHIEQPNFDDLDDDEPVCNNDVEPGASNEDNSATPQNAVIDSKLQELQEILSASGDRRKSVQRRKSGIPVEAVTVLKDSQANTVGWDYLECHKAQEENQQIEVDKSKIFMITGFDARRKESILKELQALGASALDQTQYNSTSTHLITPKPQRTEKVLSAMAAGKWILHPSYVEKSTAAGRLLEEDTFEFGNPKASKDITAHLEYDTALGPEALHYWRIEVNKRGYGAFHDMRAIVVSVRRDPIVRVVESGGGMVINDSPPFEDSVYATHCLIDTKTTPDLSVYVPLAKQGVFCVSTIYVYDFLFRNVQDARDSILPYFSEYYAD